MYMLVQEGRLLKSRLQMSLCRLQNPSLLQKCFCSHPPSLTPPAKYSTSVEPSSPNNLSLLTCFCRPSSTKTHLCILSPCQPVSICPPSKIRSNLARGWLDTRVLQLPLSWRWLWIMRWSKIPPTINTRQYFSIKGAKYVTHFQSRHNIETKRSIFGW